MDLGHANLEGQIQPFFNQLADKIVHIHASNNDGSDDQHYGVEDGDIDYVWLADTLKKIGYDKTVIVESMYKVDLVGRRAVLRHLLGIEIIDCKIDHSRYGHLEHTLHRRQHQQHQQHVGIALIISPEPFYFIKHYLTLHFYS